MKKSLIALLVVLALIVTVSVFAVSANNGTATTTPVYSSNLTVAADGATATGYCPHCQKQDVTWTAWANQTATGHYFLTASNTSAAQLTLANSANVVLHLNGKEYSRAGYSFNIPWKATLSVVDGTAGTGKMVTTGTNEVVRLSGSFACLNWYSGTLQCTATTKFNNGGCINLTGNTAVVNMYGGTMKTGGVKGNGGIVYINSGVFNMHGGTLEPTITTAAANQGGAVYVSQYAGHGACAFNMYGGEIKNFAATNGGAVYVASGTFVLDGGTISKCTSPTNNGGGVYVNGVAASGTAAARLGAMEIKKGTISECTAPKGAGGGVFVNANCSFTMSNGTITDCSSKNGGGSIRTNSNSVDLFISGGKLIRGSSNGDGGNLFSNTATDIEITGGQFTNGTAGGAGGNVCITAAGTLKIKNATFSDGTAGTNGGNVYISATPTEAITGCTLSNGKAVNKTQNTNGDFGEGLGGNVAIYKAVTFVDCTFENGTAGEGVNGKPYNVQHEGTTKYINGRGGNLHIGANSTFKNCTITGGKSWSASGGGGNIYYYGGTKHEILGTKITDGWGYNQSGNIQFYIAGATLTVDDYVVDGEVKATSEISGGTAEQRNFPNIYLGSAGQTLELKGNTVVDGAKSNGSKHGIVVGKATTKIDLYDNASVINCGNYAVYINDPSSNAASDCVVTLHGKYTGKVIVYVANKTIRTNGVVAGQELFNETATKHFTVSDDFDGTELADIRVIDGSASGKPVCAKQVDGVWGLYLGLYTYYEGVGEADANGNYEEYREVGVADWADLIAAYNAADSKVVSAKLYTTVGETTDGENADGTPTKVSAINADAFNRTLLIDLNNTVAHFVNDTNQIAVINYRTSDGTDCSVKYRYTASNEDNIVLAAKDPVTDATYLNIPDAEGRWTSNAVRIELKRVSLRPAAACANEEEHDGKTCCGIYYTAKIRANATATAALNHYGVVVGVNPGNTDVIGEDFKAQTTADGKSRWCWTLRNVEDTADLSEGVEFNSGMVADIMSTANLAEAGERGETPIEAKAYLVADIAGKLVTVLSDEKASCSVMDLADKLAEMHDDANATTKAKIEGFLKGAFENAMRTWVDVAENLAEFYA